MTLRLAHFSDIHLTESPGRVPWRALVSKRLIGWANLALLGRYRHLRDAGRVMAALVADLAALGPDHILFTGDVTGLALESEFRAAREVLEPLLTAGSITGLPGNHDLYTRASVRARLYERYFAAWEADGPPGAPPFVRLVGRDLAIVTVRDSRPTALHDSSGLVGPQQLARLEDVLARAELEGRRRVLALHYAPLRADGRPDSRLHGLRDAARLLDVAARGRVDLVAHGHLHRRFVLPAGEGTPVTLVNPGSLTYAGHEQAYHVYRFEPGWIRLEARRYDPTTQRFAPWPEASLDLPGGASS